MLQSNTSTTQILIVSCPSAKIKEAQMEDEQTILRKMRRMTDYYDIHKEIRRYGIW